MCALMIPNLKKLSPKTPYAEEEVYKELSKLSDDFIIFHSFKWVDDEDKFSRKRRYNFSWYENDFLIISKTRGIFVLEVKGGEISFKNGLMHQRNTQTGQESILNEGNDPYSQASRATNELRRIIKEKNSELGNKLKIEVAIWFPSCKIPAEGTLPSNYQQIRPAILTAENFGSIGKSIYSIYDFYNSHCALTDDEVNQLMDILAPEFNLVPSASIIKGELDKVFIRLTNEQLSLLDYISEIDRATIQGAAGTGKTLIAVEAARRYATEDNKKVLFLCFNKFLQDHLKEDCKCNNVTYMGINSLVKTFGNTMIDISDPKIRARELSKIEPEVFDYDVFIVDEAQDFDTDEIEYLYYVAELLGARILVFYDKNQVVMSSEIPSWINNTECRLILTKNCRNTYQIAISSYSVIDYKLNQKVSMVNGPDTKMVLYEKGKFDQKFGALINNLKTEHSYTNNEITVLSLKPEFLSVMNNKNKIFGQTISRVRDNKNIFYTTAKKFKGLESKVVVITDINESSFSSEEEKRVFYVACSRATQYLILMIDENTENLNNIANAITSIGRYAPKMKILQMVKAKEWNL